MPLTDVIGKFEVAREEDAGRPSSEEALALFVQSCTCQNGSLIFRLVWGNRQSRLPFFPRIDTAIQHELIAGMLVEGARQHGLYARQACILRQYNPSLSIWGETYHVLLHPEEDAFKEELQVYHRCWQVRRSTLVPRGWLILSSLSSWAGNRWVARSTQTMGLVVWPHVLTIYCTDPAYEQLHLERLATGRMVQLGQALGLPLTLGSDVLFGYREAQTTRRRL